MIEFMLLYAVLGAFAGVLAGLLGVGGGLVIVPMLVMAFAWQGLPPEMIMHLALGTSMGSIVFTSISSTLSHHRRGGVDWVVVRSITLGIIVGTYLGSFAAAKVPSQALQIIFVVFLCYVGTQMLSGKKPKPSRHLPGFVGMTAAGGVIGVVSSLVGIGGGTLSVPFMLWNNVEARRAIGTSAAIGFPIAVSGCIGYMTNGWNTPGLPEYSVGFLYLPALVSIVAMSMLTAPLGAKMAHTLPVGKLKKCFAVLLFAMAVKMLWGIL